MRKRMAVLLTALLWMLCATALPIAAEHAFPLLSEDATVAPDPTGTYAYTEDGALTVTSNGEPMTVVLEVGKEIDLDSIRYLQFAAQATAPFNIALKIGGDAYDAYPQLSGPSWYEAFQETAPPADGGVAAGTYVMSLDIRNYMEYNDRAIPKNGEVTLKSIYITLYSAGTMTLSHLAVSDTAEFVTANSQSGVVATTMAPIITHTQSTKLPTRYNGNQYDYANYGDSASPDSSAAGVIWIIVFGVSAIGAVVLLTVLKKRRLAEEEELSEEEGVEETESEADETESEE